MSSTPYREIGGSGGYIYIKTQNKVFGNIVNEGVRIEAQGGFGTNGGSGGVIIFESKTQMEDDQFNAQGGASTN